MKLHRILLLSVLAFTLAGCANPSENAVANTKQCVGPPDFCTPFFGS